MQAEQARETDASVNEFLDLSIRHLNEAIRSFRSATELSTADRSAEIGDCQSLLGRSYLFAHDLAKAADMVREAIGRIRDENSKDYADLQILMGDLAHAKGETDAAVSFYDAAIRAAGTQDAEKSEIAARAYLQKGRALESKGWLSRAAEIWATLEEDERADEARWFSMELEKRVPSSAERVFKRTTVAASVRVEAIQMFEDAVAGMGSARGRRAEPDEGYWEELLPEAQKNVTVRHLDW